LNDEDTLPPFRSIEERDERARMRPWAIVAWLVVLVLAGLILAGCAPLPKCPIASIEMIEVEGRKFYVFDQANWTRAVATYRGLSEGSCALSKPGKEV